MMADPTTTSCADPDHASLVATICEQTRLISRLLTKIEKLETKLEVAEEAARRPAVSQNPPSQTPNFVAPEGGYVGQHDYSSLAPSAYEAKKTQAQGQLCSYGSKCIREQCWYEHPGSRVAGNANTSASTTDTSQPTGNSTKHINQECSYGIKCTRKKCWFEHPSDWVPPNSTVQEPQPQQEFNSEAPAAEAGNWGPMPSNDWGTPVDNTWGPPQADNSWGNSSDTNWNTHPDNRPKFPVNNSRSPSVSMSRERSVSSSSTNKSQGRERKARGKGRRADSESIATESTPMSPSPLATNSTSADVEPISMQASLFPDQTPPYNEANTLDEMGTPPLEPSVPSLSSEPEAPTTPKALWSDEPAVDVVYFPDPPPNLDEPQPSAPEDQPPTEFVDPSVNLDQSAPSDLYSSWGVVGPSASDWGLDPNEFPDPTPTPKPSGKKSKSKGKQKESSQTGTAGRGTLNNSSNFAAQSETSTPPINESNELELEREPQLERKPEPECEPEPERKPEPEPELEPEPEPVPMLTPDPPQGVPQDQIPDWLLGDDEDAHAALGIPRSVSPNPGGSAAPPRLAPTNPTPRTPLSKLSGENFPALGGILSAAKLAQLKDEPPPKPAFSPRPVGWKIIPSDASSSSGRSGKGSKFRNDSTKK